MNLPESRRTNRPSVRDILISSAVCIACLLVALVSQIVAPSTVVAAAPAPAAQSAAVQTADLTTSSSPMELDPEETNPTLFAMAPDSNQADASALGGPMNAEKSQLTASGLRITDIEVGDGAEATAGQSRARRSSRGSIAAARCARRPERAPRDRVRRSDAFLGGLPPVGLARAGRVAHRRRRRRRGRGRHAVPAADRRALPAPLLPPPGSGPARCLDSRRSVCSRRRARRRSAGSSCSLSAFLCVETTRRRR